MRVHCALLLLLGLAAIAAAGATGAAGTAEADSAAPSKPSLISPSLRLHPRELPASLGEQAANALARDAWRRELRFLEAIEPGYLFGTTRIDQSEIDRGELSPGDLYESGGRLFHVAFTDAMGFGGPDGSMKRIHEGRRGGPDARSCSDCHRVGGPAGAGDAVNNAYLDGDGLTQESALARNPRALHGAGLVEILAAEMSAELAATRERLIEQAAGDEAPVRGALAAKGVPFGHLTARVDGTLDTDEVEGVDSDLVVKPFGWKGTYATIREAVEEELLVHHGMQSSHLATNGPVERVGTHPRPDPDGDGHVDEIGEGQLSALTAYIAMQEIPQIEPPRETLVPVTAWAEGRRRFEQIGCAGCHAISLPLESTVYTLPGREGGPPLKIDLAREGAQPRIAPQADGGGYRVYLFSDLKRHDLGPSLVESRPDRGVAPSWFPTAPLWGIARGKPYLHDARSPTLADAILQHGGEAQAARDRFAALTETERAPLRVFLTSLTRARRMVSP